MPVLERRGGASKSQPDEPAPALSSNSRSQADPADRDGFSLEEHERTCMQSLL